MELNMFKVLEINEKSDLFNAINGEKTYKDLMEDVVILDNQSCNQLSTKLVSEKYKIFLKNQHQAI